MRTEFNEIKKIKVNFKRNWRVKMEQEEYESIQKYQKYWKISKKRCKKQLKYSKIKKLKISFTCLTIHKLLIT